MGGWVTQSHASTLWRKDPPHPSIRLEQMWSSFLWGPLSLFSLFLLIIKTPLPPSIIECHAFGNDITYQWSLIKCIIHIWFSKLSLSWQLNSLCNHVAIFLDTENICNLSVLFCFVVLSFVVLRFVVLSTLFICYVDRLATGGNIIILYNILISNNCHDPTQP